MENLFYILSNVSCGNGANGPLVIDATLPSAISTIVNIMKVAIPVLVVVFGLIDLGKAVMSAKEDDIKKNQGLLIKRLIVAVLVFFVVSIVQFVVSLVGGSNDSVNPYKNCFDCFINNECSPADDY